MVSPCPFSSLTLLFLTLNSFSPDGYKGYLLSLLYHPLLFLLSFFLFDTHSSLSLSLTHTLSLSLSVSMRVT